MKTLTITKVAIQVDSIGKSVKEVKKIIDVINTTLQEANLECQPQIFLDNIRAEDSISESVFDLRDK